MSRAFDKVVEWLHKKKKFNAEMLSEKEPRSLIEETFNVLQKPLKDLSVKQEIPPELTAALDENVFVFSGFKTYHELKEASMLLKDDDGGFKPFDRFRRDVEAIDSTYNKNYLAAEYEFAVASSQMAVRWKDLEKDGDRYDLQYRTAGDDRVRPEHAALNGITLPPSDKFWDEYYPPNGWRCRCTAVQVRRGKYPESDSDEAVKAGEKATTQIGKDGTNKGKIFRFNPGKQEKIFPPKHPYLPKGCGNCEYNKLVYNSKSEKCRVCRIIQNNANEVIKESKKSSKDKKRIKSDCEKFINTLPSITIGSEISHQKVIATANGDKIRVGKTFFNETFSKNIHNKQLEEIMNLAMDFEKWMPNLPKGRIEKGIHHDFNFMAYEIKYNGYEIVFKTKLTEGQIAYTMRIKKRN